MRRFSRRIVVPLTVLAVLVLAPARTSTMQGSDWNVGEVFVGLGDPGGFAACVDFDPITFECIPTTEPGPALDLYNLLGTYRVLGETGTFHEDLKMPVAGITTGCAVDRTTGSFWATSFDSQTVDALSGLHPHARIGSVNVAQQATSPPGVSAVESIVFDRAGNYYVGIPDEDVDFNFNLNIIQYDGFGTLLKFSPAGTRLGQYRLPVNLYPSGYLPDLDTDSRAGRDPIPRGVDWFDISADGTTIFYTSEDHFVRTFRFDADPLTPGEQPGPGPGNALAINGVTYPATPGVWGYVDDADRKNFGLRLLPPGDGSGGLLVAAPYGIYRLNRTGTRVAFMSAPGAHKFFAVSLSPDARYVWTATQLGTPAVFKFHIATGQLMPLGTSDRLPMPAPVNGLCLKLEYTAQSVDCTATPTSPLCQRIEVCSDGSPGDDDGDGLADGVDPDCDVRTVNRPPTISLNDRVDNERTFQSFTLPATDADGDALTYTFSALPAGISYDASTRTVSGTLADVTATFVITITATVTDLIDSVSTTFRWTVVNLPNHAPVCTSASLSGGDLWPPNHKLVPFRVAGVTDPDRDPLTVTITSIFQNEPPNPSGDGDTEVDGVIDGATAWLRAERAGTKSSRIYRVGFTASDGHATCAGTAYSAVVPHDQGKPPVPPATTWYDSTVLTAPVKNKKK